MNTNFVFFGTDEFAVKVLEELKAESYSPTLIVTTPDSKKGRDLKLTPSPVKLWAQANGIEFVQPANLRSDLGASLRSDLFVVASYGKIIPKEILDLPKHGTLNIHPSLLPKYRGAAPLQSAILNGDTETGVSIMLLDEEMDHGAILSSIPYHLSPSTSFIELRDDLAKLGAQTLAKILPDYLASKIKPIKQDHSQATYTQKITKNLSQLNLTDSPEINDRKIRALNPNPGTYFIDNNKRIKVLSAHIENGVLLFERIIPEGKKEMDWESYLRGRQ